MVLQGKRCADRKNNCAVRKCFLIVVDAQLVSGRNAGSFLEQRVVIECIVAVVTGNLN